MNHFHYDTAAAQEQMNARLQEAENERMAREALDGQSRNSNVLAELGRLLVEAGTRLQQFSGEDEVVLQRRNA